MSQRILIDQLVYKYFLTDESTFESYLDQTNPNERYLNKIIWESRSYLDEVIGEQQQKGGSWQNSLSASSNLYGADKIWLVAVQQLKNVYRSYEIESCSFEITINIFKKLVEHIELAIKPNLVALWSLTRSDPINLRLLFPAAYKYRRNRQAGPLLTWLTNPVTADESAVNLFQSALLSLGFDDEDPRIPFLSLSDSLRQHWRIKVSDPTAELPLDPIELVPTCLIFPERGTSGAPVGGSVTATTFTTMERALNYHKESWKIPIKDSFGKDDVLTDREIDSMTIYLGLLLLSMELPEVPRPEPKGRPFSPTRPPLWTEPPLETRPLAPPPQQPLCSPPPLGLPTPGLNESECYDLLSDWFVRLSLLIPDEKLRDCPMSDHLEAVSSAALEVRDGD